MPSSGEVLSGVPYDTVLSGITCFGSGSLIT